jgi:hypothetical protein
MKVAQAKEPLKFGDTRRTDKILDINNLEKERLILAHSFRCFSMVAWFCVSQSVIKRCIMVKENCSLHSGQETEKQREAQVKIYSPKTQLTSKSLHHLPGTTSNYESISGLIH